MSTEHTLNTPEQRAEWRALADKATPGPWDTYMVPGTRSEEAYVAVEASETEVRIARYEGGHFDGAFIAAARTAVPALLADVERLTAERDALAARIAAVRAVAYLYSSEHSDGCGFEDCARCTIDQLLAALNGEVAA